MVEVTLVVFTVLHFGMETLNSVTIIKSLRWVGELWIFVCDYLAHITETLIMCMVICTWGRLWWWHHMAKSRTTALIFEFGFQQLIVANAQTGYNKCNLVFKLLNSTKHLGRYFGWPWHSFVPFGTHFEATYMYSASQCGTLLRLVLI